MKIGKHSQRSPEQRADDLDQKLTEVLQPTRDQLAGVLAFLDHLTRVEWETGYCETCKRPARDYRSELAVFWIGQHVEQREPRRMRGTE